jgi:CRISPR-associated protein Cas1
MTHIMREETTHDSMESIGSESPRITPAEIDPPDRRHEFPPPASGSERTRPGGKTLDAFAELRELEVGPSLDQPHRRTVFVDVQGAKISVRKGQLMVSSSDGEPFAVPSSHVARVILFGAVQLSSSARDWALREGIDVTICSRIGIYRGRLEGSGSHRVSLRRAQYRMTGESDARLRVARAIVSGKVANQIALLSRYARRNSDDLINTAVVRLRSSRHGIETAPTIAVLMGHEGAAARAYFGAWNALLPDDVTFKGRSYRPALDTVNAALALGYSILTGNAVAAIAAAGLDPCAGVLHADSDGRPSLALDLIEEFRPLIVDTVVLDAFRRRILDERSSIESPDGVGHWLAADTRGAFLRRLEERMLTYANHSPTGRRMSWRNALHLQADQLAAVFQGTRSYEAVKWR